MLECRGGERDVHVAVGRRRRPVRSTLTTAPGAGTFAGAVISRLVTAPRPVHRQDRVRLAAGTLTRTDGTSWLDDGFLEGQLIKIGSDPAPSRSSSISGTHRPGSTSSRSPAKATEPLAAASRARHLTLTQWAAVVTFSPTELVHAGHRPASSPTRGSPSQPGQRGPRRAFAKRRTCSAASAARSRSRAARPRPTGRSRRRPAPGRGQRARSSRSRRSRRSAQQIDTLNIFDDSSQEDLTGTLTSTGAHGPRHGTGLDFTAARSAPAGRCRSASRSVYPGGISYGERLAPSTAQFQTDELDEHDRGAEHAARRGQRPPDHHEHARPGPGPQLRRQRSAPSRSTAASRPSTAAATARLEVRGELHLDATTLTRDDGVSWASAGFAVGQTLTVDGRSSAPSPARRPVRR